MFSSINTDDNYRNYPFIVLLLIGLYLCEGMFGLLPMTKFFFPVYFLFFLSGYKNDTPFSKPLLLLMVSMVLSMFSCLIFHNQDIISSFGSNVTYAAICIFFVLCKLKLDPIIVERVLFWMFIIFCACYIYQVLVFPKLVFLSSDARIDYNLPIFLRRIRFPGMSLVGLGAFFSLNKILIGQNKYIVPYVLALIVILLFGFRTLLVFITVFSFVIIIRVYGFSYKIMLAFIFLCIIAWLFSLTEFGQTIFNTMLERQEGSDNFSNKDYIRYTTLYYYYNDHYKNFIEMLLGSGLPQRGTGSIYEAYYIKLESCGIHYFDWGLLGISWMMGMLSLVAMIWYPIRAFLTRMPNDKLYLSVWFGYLFACAFTSAEFVRQGCFLVQGIALYLITIYSNQYSYEKDYNCE